VRLVELPGGRRIGPGEPCFVAVEVGLNHNGDVHLAHRLIDAAADAGADAVKFQNFRTEDFISDRSVTYEYVSGGRSIREAQYDMFKRYELSGQSWEELRGHCESRSVVFFATPTGDDSLAELVRLRTPLLKNGSDYLVHLPLIRKMAETGIPTVLSTGMATLDEIDDAVDAFRRTGGRDLVLLHCTSTYPTPPADVHLRKIPALAARYGCPVGLSDHTFGVVAALGAVTLGACFLEKHFTLNKALPGPDHRFSADPAELRELVDGVRTLERNLGTAEVGPTASEQEARRDFRLSCVAARDLSRGHEIALDDIAFSRPGTGLPPKRAADLVGLRITVPLAAGKVFPVELVAAAQLR
jgi:N-acetylneuraminate synthase/N,N'-diacetyllegionaminate synthase